MTTFTEQEQRAADSMTVSYPQRSTMRCPRCHKLHEMAYWVQGHAPIFKWLLDGDVLSKTPPCDNSDIIGMVIGYHPAVDASRYIRERDDKDKARHDALMEELDLQRTSSYVQGRY